MSVISATWDESEGLAYIKLRELPEGQPSSTLPCPADVVLHFDGNANLVGIEILISPAKIQRRRELL